MNRPFLVNFSAIDCKTHLSVRASISNSDISTFKEKKKEVSSPIQSIKLFSKENFRLKIKAIADDGVEVFSKEYDSDNYGKFELKIPTNGQSVNRILCYETSQLRGIDIHMGNFLPLILSNPNKIIISDFDKTLCDTKYHTAKEVYYSLNKPLSFFPTIEPSVEMMKKYIKEDYVPFILSASPHFYEKAIRDWLYQNKIYTSQIFLKDYRDFISVFDGHLTTKDLKKQGFYKLNQLVDILLRTGLPEDVILMGDGFESDPYIYLTLFALINDQADPWKLWSSIKNHSIFNLTTKQNSYFLTKFYRLSELSKQKNSRINIYIRTKDDQIEKLKQTVFDNTFLDSNTQKINYYCA
jgi:phosphatidate phosphatase APP1